MSYILDALKKLEQKRQQGSVPDLMTIHAPVRLVYKKRVIWPYIVLGALVLNAGILAAVFRPWESGNKTAASHITVQPVKKNEPVSASPQVKTGTAVPAKKPVVPKASLNATIHPSDAKKTVAGPSYEKVEVPVEVKKKESVQVEEPPLINKEYSDAASPSGLSMNPSPQEIEILRNKIKEETSLSSSITPRKSQPVEKAEADSDGQVIDFSQLPEDTKKELPNITISAHIYSNNPGSRIVNINGSTVREGDEVTKGLKVREITMSGVILDYQGRRFQVRAF